MTKPWFKKFGVFGYRPIAPEGYAVTAIMGLTFFIGALLWLGSPDDQSTRQWFGIGLAASAAVIGHILIWRRFE